MTFRITSTAFEESTDIPLLYTHKGKNISPPLAWDGVPENTKTFAIIMEDPDTPIGLWTHWLIYNIPGEKRELPENFPNDKEFPDGTKQRRNSKWKVGYDGPAPPWGKHRYYFRLYALDTKLDLGPCTRRKKLLKAMEGHILEEARLMGYFSKKMDK